MANFMRGSFLLKNNSLVDKVGIVLQEESYVYEVLRVIDFVPLFWEEHFYRMQHSAKLASCPISINKFQFAKSLKKLIQANGIAEGNIRIDLSGETYFYFVQHVYPKLLSYENGVEVGLFYSERDMPQAKIVQRELREATNGLINEKRVHEVLLVNKDNQITEGSRSNVFFVKGKQFFTPPVDQVLPGITRQKVMECINSIHLDVIEKTIKTEDLAGFDASFLTGTSPKVLPIRKIDDHTFTEKNCHVRRIIQKYDQMIQSYISQNRDFYCS